MIGVAVNVVFVPVQIVFPWFEFIVTDGIATDVTTILLTLLVEFGGVAQVASLVITQVISSPFANAFDENVLLLVPTFAPFFFH